MEIHSVYHLAEVIQQTRLHSSRMHTARLLTVSPSMHCAGGSPCQGGLLGVEGGVGGGPPCQGGLLARGVCLARGMSPCQGVCLARVGLLARGICLARGCLLAGGRGVVVSQHVLRQTALWTEFLTHATENITFPQTSFAGGKYSWKNSVLVSAPNIGAGTALLSLRKSRKELEFRTKS